MTCHFRVSRGITTNNEDFELASKAKNLMEQIINNNADYIIKK